MRTFTLITILLVFLSVSSRRNLPTYEVNLDLPYEQRYAAVTKDLVPVFNKVVDFFINGKYHNQIMEVAKGISILRGPEKDKELQLEIEYWTKATGQDFALIQLIQSVYAISEFMVPIVNITNFADVIGEKWATKLKIDHIDLGAEKHKDLLLGVHKFLEMKSCMGILARDAKDGSIYHARNYDMPIQLNPLQYIANFTKGGKHVFYGSQIVAFAGVFTGFKAGAFAIEMNSRFPDHVGGNEEILDNYLEKKMPYICWLNRKNLETETDFDKIVDFYSNGLSTIAPAYMVISGPTDGVILAREPSSLAHMLSMKGKNGTNQYIIVTNFDYWWGDIREYVDPTGGDIGHPRRIFAEHVMNTTNALPPLSVWQAINAKGAIAIGNSLFDKDDVTNMQAIMNVKTGYFNQSSPIDLNHTALVDFVN